MVHTPDMQLPVRACRRLQLEAKVQVGKNKDSHTANDLYCICTGMYA